MLGALASIAFAFSLHAPDDGQSTRDFGTNLLQPISVAVLIQAAHTLLLSVLWMRAPRCARA